MVEMAEIREKGYLLYKAPNLTMAIGNPATAGLSLHGKLNKSDTEGLIGDTRAVVAAIARRVAAGGRVAGGDSDERS